MPFELQDLGATVSACLTTWTAPSLAITSLGINRALMDLFLMPAMFSDRDGHLLSNHPFCQLSPWTALVHVLRVKLGHETEKSTSQTP